MLVVLRRVFDRWPGIWTGVAIGGLGVALAAAAYAAQFHAWHGTIVDAHEQYEFRGPGPVHLVGVVSPGEDAERPTTCAVGSAGLTSTIEVGMRTDRFDTIGAGRRLPDPSPVTITCDRRVSVTSGPMVNAYALATDRSILAGYGVLALLGVGFAVFAFLARRRATRAGVASTPSHPRGGATHTRPGVAALFVMASAGTLAVLAMSVLGWPSMTALLTPVLFAAACSATLLTVGWSKTA